VPVATNIDAGLKVVLPEVLARIRNGPNNFHGKLVTLAPQNYGEVAQLSQRERAAGWVS